MVVGGVPDCAGGYRCVSNECYLTRGKFRVREVHFPLDRFRLAVEASRGRNYELISESLLISDRNGYTGGQCTPK